MPNVALRRCVCANSKTSVGGSTVFIFSLFRNIKKVAVQWDFVRYNKKKYLAEGDIAFLLAEAPSLVDKMH